MKIREVLTRATQFFLGLDGVLHLLEVVSAYREQAWMTFGLTGFHTLIFFAAVYFIGHDHTHHRQNEVSSNGESV